VNKILNKHDHFLFLAVGILNACSLLAQKNNSVIKLIPIDSGWANNSVNTVIFRKNSLVSFKDTQYIAFYNQQHYMVLGKRRLGEEKWQLRQTPYQGNVTDAHNCISIMVDGDGYLHVAWDHHNNPLHYCKSKVRGSLELSEKTAMTGMNEQRVSYPEFYKLPNGNLLFFYRNGESGQGNLVINYYDIQTQKWAQLYSNLLDGEAKRNAYWQSCVDGKGTIHLSWVWRETADVASNHDLCYARSTDGGKTWERSNGEKYVLPITAATAEYACKIPESHELINQTSMTAGANGNPVIATYWRDADSKIPQYHIVHNDGKDWKTLTPDFRKTVFSLTGVGSKRIPISRPQVVIKENSVMMIFRDDERGNKVSLLTIPDWNYKKAVLQDLTSVSVGSWEPTYDSELWREKGVLNLFVQKVEQADAEGISNIPPQMIYVLEWKPNSHSIKGSKRKLQ
jgi:hypothetical protein